MKRAAAIGVLLSFFSVLGSADDHPEWLSQGSINGRFWTAMSGLEKSAYVVGYREAMGFAYSVTTESESLKVLNMPDLPNGDVVKGVDKFYPEPENLRFPVRNALAIFAMKVAGASQKDIDTAMDILRKVFP